MEKVVRMALHRHNAAAPHYRRSRKRRYVSAHACLAIPRRLEGSETTRPRDHARWRMVIPIPPMSTQRLTMAATAPSESRLVADTPADGDGKAGGAAGAGGIRRACGS